MLALNTEIGGFKLTGLISETGAAQLFDCIQLKTGQPFLCKLARRQWSCDTQDQLQGFKFSFSTAQDWDLTPSELLQLECEFLAQLKEPESYCLPKLAKTGEHANRAYAIFEHFPGESLKTSLFRYIPPEPPLLLSLLSAIHRLHSAGMFHGNIQPSSILINEQEVLLLDTTFGAALFTDSSCQDLLRCCTSPRYYPTLHPAHDQLAVGLLLYQLHAGRHPLETSAAQPMKRPRRRIGPVLARFYDQAREQGASRYVSDLLEFVNPSQIIEDLAVQTERLILNTVGLQRKGIGSADEMLEAVPGSWLYVSEGAQPKCKLEAVISDLQSMVEPSIDSPLQ